VLSTVPLDSENTTTMNAIMNSIVTGITDVFISSSLDVVEPIAPYINA
jgi:hypothetical protein